MVVDPGPDHDGHLHRVRDQVTAAGAVAVGPAGDILIADAGNDRVRQVGG